MSDFEKAKLIIRDKSIYIVGDSGSELVFRLSEFGAGFSKNGIDGPYESFESRFSKLIRKISGNMNNDEKYKEDMLMSDEEMRIFLEDCDRRIEDIRANILELSSRIEKALKNHPSSPDCSKKTEEVYKDAEDDYPVV